MDKFKCLLCKSTSGMIIKHGTRDSEHDVMKCEKCGLVQLFPLPTIREDAEYYDNNVHDKVTVPSLDIDGIYEKFLYQNENKYQYLERRIKMSKKWKMLDYASGYGFFIQLMLEKGYVFDGVEISKERLSICKERLSKMEYEGGIYSFNLLEDDVPEDLREKYDLITMFHLFEHLINPVEMLRKVKQLLKRGGILAMELPNYDNNMVEISKEFHDFFFIRDHVAYYTPETLKRPMEEVGFKEIEIEGVQVYGLENHMNWILNKGPQLIKPSYEACEGMRWIEKIYKKQLEKKVKSEYMSVIAKNI